MQEKISRRGFIKKMIGTIFTIAAFGSGGYYYAREMEPKMLTINHHTFSHSHIPQGFDQFKIIQFSDTHLGFQYTIKQFNQLIDKMNQLNPDVIFFTGDLLDEPNKYEDQEQIITSLSRLKAPFGKFAIYGNHDHGGYGTDIYKNIMAKSDFVLLQNSYEEIRLLDDSIIHIIGLDDAMLGKPNLDIAINNLPEETFKILLAHEPDIADIAINRGIHLQLSGHSHGGQVKIPFVGALIKPPLSEQYYEGFYDLGNTHSPFSLYVNRGLGTTRLPFRFLSKPELTIFTLNRV